MPKLIQHGTMYYINLNINGLYFVSFRYEPKIEFAFYSINIIFARKNWEEYWPLITEIKGLALQLPILCR